MDTQHKQKIAILGGGVSAITAAFSLTSDKNWRDRYDITLYQLGWRIGGKGASGRNLQDHDRIEEHGIHVWFGFYYNAFHNMRLCYEELGRPADAPLATLEEAFVPHHSTAFAQHFEKNWAQWPIETFALPGKVGEGWNPEPLMDALAKLVAWLLEHTGMDTQGQHGGLPFLQRLEHEMTEHLDTALLGQLRQGLQQVLQGLQAALPHQGLIDLLQGVRQTAHLLTAPFVAHHIKIARLWMILDLGLTALIGMLVDEVYAKGFDSLNDTNFVDWLEKHGASRLTCEGPLVASIYGGVFAYQGGKLSQPRVETGTLMRAGLTAVSCSKESFIWRMQAGMGDVVFGPYYEVLKRRGVTFKFFHKVEELIPAQNAESFFIDKIKLVEQVPLAKPEEGYDPLVPVKGLPCWPSTPKYELIRKDVAELLQQHQIDLESSWTDWSNYYQQPEIVLEQGKDFDLVVLGTSIATLPIIAPKLLEQDKNLNTMVNTVQTVATQAGQLWLNRNIQELGWIGYHAGEEAPEILGFNYPDWRSGKFKPSQQAAMDSWADVSYLVERETWSKDDAPKDISYFCGVFDEDTPPPPGPNPAYPASQKAKAKAYFKELLDQPLLQLWQEAGLDGHFNWDLLVDPQGGKGEARLNSQYWRANVDPYERYVQSVPNSSKTRLPTEGSIFANLYLTGDWIGNGFNMGCVESATLSGLQTARAIRGSTEVIPLEDLFIPR